HEGEDLEDEKLLRLEVVVDEALGDPGLLGDLLDRGVLVALTAKDRERGLEDLFAGVGGHPALSLLISSSWLNAQPNLIGHSITWLWRLSRPCAQAVNPPPTVARKLQSEARGLCLIWAPRSR